MGTTTTLVTVQEFLALPELEEKHIELIGGEVVDMGEAGRPHEFVKSNVTRLLIAWLLRGNCGRVFPETGFRVDDYNALIPDISYVLEGPGKPGDKSVPQGVPDLAIEVVSSESAARLTKKVTLYLSHGSKSVWVIYPEEQTVWVHSPGRAVEFRSGAMLEDPTVLPGFSAPVSAIFEGI